MPANTTSSYDTKTKLPKAEKESGRSVDNPHPRDVPGAFAALQSEGSHLRARCDNHIAGYRYTDFTFYNHFQGLQRIGASNYLVISGGDPGVTAGSFSNAPASHLFLIQMGSRKKPLDPWGSNLPVTDQDQIVRTLVLDNEMWHAGGISLLGHILAVPIYGKDPITRLFHSDIVFLDLSFPDIPKLFPFRIKRTDAKAGAVALTRLPNGYFVCAVWSDDDKRPKRAPRFDFYISRKPDIYNGFHNDAFATWYASEVVNAPGVAGKFTEYQAVNFVTQRYDKNHPFQLFLVGMERKKDSGGDTADLYSVEFGQQLPTAAPRLHKPVITKIDVRNFTCKDAQGQFNAASGIHVAHKGRMYLYSAYYWRIDNMIRFTEFADGTGQPADLG